MYCTRNIFRVLAFLTAQFFTSNGQSDDDGGFVIYYPQRPFPFNQQIPDQAFFEPPDSVQQLSPQHHHHHDEEPTAGGTHFEEPTAGQAYVEEPTAGQTYVEEPTAGQTYVEEPTAGQTYVEEPTADDRTQSTRPPTQQYTTAAIPTASIDEISGEEYETLVPDEVAPFLKETGLGSFYFDPETVNQFFHDNENNSVVTASEQGGAEEKGDWQGFRQVESSSVTSPKPNPKPTTTVSATNEANTKSATRAGKDDTFSLRVRNLSTAPAAVTIPSRRPSNSGTSTEPWWVSRDRSKSTTKKQRGSTRGRSTKQNKASTSRHANRNNRTRRPQKVTTTRPSGSITTLSRSTGERPGRKRQPWWVVRGEKSTESTKEQSNEQDTSNQVASIKVVNVSREKGDKVPWWVEREKNQQREREAVNRQKGRDALSQTRGRRIGHNSRNGDNTKGSKTAPARKSKLPWWEQRERSKGNKPNKQLVPSNGDSWQKQGDSLNRPTRIEVLKIRGLGVA